jgi:hypothetical protein
MKKIKLIFMVTLISILTIFITACNGNDKKAAKNTENISNREYILSNDKSDEKRNILLREDIEFLRNELPKKHKNPFSIITKEEFDNKLSNLYNNVDKLNNGQVFIEMGKIISSIGDGHTKIDYWDGKSYPLEFYIFDEEIYVINADKTLQDMMYSKIVSIDNVDYKDIITELTEQISYENESWLKDVLPSRIMPTFLYGLGIAEGEKSSIFRVEKNGEIKDFTVPILPYGMPYFGTDKANDKITGKHNINYDYKFIEENNTLYFEYNVCAETGKGFKDFNTKMFKDIESKSIKKIVIDLRANSGGNSEVLNPFIDKLKTYIKDNKNVKVYILVGRHTFSAGMFAIFYIKKAVPEAICLGEPSGGAIDRYGDMRNFNLTNSNLLVRYSTKYFEFSKTFKYKINKINAFIPDILLSPSIEDYINGRDVVLEYVLND